MTKHSKTPAPAAAPALTNIELVTEIAAAAARQGDLLNRAAAAESEIFAMGRAIATAAAKVDACGRQHGAAQLAFDLGELDRAGLDGAAAALVAAEAEHRFALEGRGRIAALQGTADAARARAALIQAALEPLHAEQRARTVRRLKDAAVTRRAAFAAHLEAAKLAAADLRAVGEVLQRMGEANWIAANTTKIDLNSALIPDQQAMAAAGAALRDEMADVIGGMVPESNHAVRISASGTVAAEMVAIGVI